MKHPIKCPREHKANPKRVLAKEKRGFGSLAMKKSKMDQAEWSQKHDPLFKIKGLERYLKSCEQRGIQS